MNPIDIRVISDFVCPWCPIGEKQLEAAVRAVGSDIPVRVSYEPFELNPDMPKEGLNRREYRSRKFGSWARSQAMDAQVTDAGQRVGVTFNYDIIEHTPNTRLAHRLTSSGSANRYGTSAGIELRSVPKTPGRLSR